MPFRDDLRPGNLVALEEELLRTWDAEGTFKASLAARSKSRPWIFYEGPPTANGRPGVHHVLSRSIKDFACRLKTMQGFLVERKAGWDTHGLPVEIAAEKALGLEGKDAIEKLGVAEFNRVCRESVFTYLTDWERMTRRIGYWLDFETAYKTLSNDYIESVWAILADWHRRGILFRGHKVMPYCPRCGTPLSSHEVGLGFLDVQDPSVYVRFRALSADGQEAPESFLVWTTTPWTLPSNVALAVHPDVDYVKVKVSEGDGKTETLWLAEPRLPALKAKPGQVEVLERLKGAALVGRRYRRLLDFYDVASAPNAFTVRPATFVTTTDGTGIVHMAPAYGEDDAAVGRRDALPTLHPVDAAGKFVAGPRAGLVAGKFVKDADKDVIRHMKEHGLLLRQETIVHSYPHCWRCDTPLLYYARDSWYARTTQFREQLVEFNAKTKWYPESTGTGRMGQWLENNVDWAISRDRYWGTPLPLWRCERKECGNETAIGSVEELRRAAGRLPEPLDLHRPYVDDLTWRCGKDGCAGTMRRTPEVADVWLDSGSMPFAQWHYPFENKERVERELPADFIAEAVDQTRGWFYVLLAVAVLYKGKPAYRSCVSTDLVLDAKGKKMSKSRGNIVVPDEVIAKYGADVVRWHLLTSRPLWQPLRFDEKDLEDTRNRFFGTFASTYQFFALYANVDGYAEAEPPPTWKPTDVFDRWLLSRLDRLVTEVSADVDAYETSRAGKRIVEFVVEDLSNWYVRRNRRRFWKGALTDGKREGYRTLHVALANVARLVAPVAPFLSDALHRALSPRATGSSASVHLAGWPTPVPGRRDPALEEEMEALRTVVSLGHAARNKAGIKVRRPLSRLTTGHAQSRIVDFLKANSAVVLDELNVKEIELVRGFEAAAKMRASLAKKEAAPRLGPKTKPAEDALAALPEARVSELAARLAREGKASVALASGEAIELTEPDVRFVLEDAAGASCEYAHGILVRLDTTITPTLEAEGLAREFLHALQGRRKDKGLEVTDRVRVSWRSQGGLAAAVRTHAGWIAEELLATSFAEAPALPERADDRVEVDGQPAFVALEVEGA